MPEKRLVLFADYVCPWCRLAESIAERLRGSGLVVEGAAFELRPAGTPLTAADSRVAGEWERSIEPLAAELGVVMRRQGPVTRTRKAHEAAAFARSEGAYEAMHRAIYTAYWEEGRDIGRIDVLTEIGSEAGLDAGRLRVALDIDQWTERVEQDEARAARLELAGVPAYVLETDGTGVAAGIRVGLQRYDELKAWVEHDDI